MRILYLEHYAGSARHGMEYRPYFLAREWVKAGHDVTIAAASWAHTRSVQPEKSTVITSEHIDGIRYLWIPTKEYEGNGLGRMRNILAFLSGLGRMRSELGKEGFDVVIASSTYPFDNGIAHRLAKKWGALHVFEVHDLWPLSPMELGGYSKHHPAIVLTQHSEDRAYRQADLVVSLLPKAEGYMRSRGLEAGKFAHIPNGIVVDEWGREEAPLPGEQEAWLREWGRGRFLVGYAGAHGVANALDSFVKAGFSLDSEKTGLVLVGQGPEKEGLKRLAGESPNILFLDSIPKGSIPAFLSRMDLLYIGLQRQSLFRFGISPNKLMDYMMAGKPVLCAIDAGNDIVSDAGCGKTIEPENTSAVVAAVNDFAAMDGSILEAMGARGRAYVLEHHEMGKLAGTFLEEMQTRIKAKGRR